VFGIAGTLDASIQAPGAIRSGNLGEHMTGTEYLDMLKERGFTVNVRESGLADCVSPTGVVYLYKPTTANQYASWLNVNTCFFEPLYA
jgi:hypothetical protein